MTDDHHDERYEDGDDSTGTVEDYPDWQPVPVIAMHLRPGDVIERNGRQMEVAQTDRVNRFIEVVSTKNEMFFVRWDKQYVVMRDEQH